MTKNYNVFKQLLHENGLDMKEEEQVDVFINKGRLSVSEYHMVDFAVMFTKDMPSTYQVVFNNVAYCKDYHQRSEYLESINQLNAQYGVYYYLALDNDGRIYARHIHLVQNDMQQCVDMLLSGVTFVQKAIEEFTDKFGEFVNI